MNVKFFHTYIRDNGKALRIIESVRAFPFIPQLFQIFGCDKNILAIIPLSVVQLPPVFGMSARIFYK
jgi:hypothetical protein